MITREALTPKFLEKLVEDDKLDFTFFYRAPSIEYKDSGPFYDVEGEQEITIHIMPFKKIVLVSAYYPNNGDRDFYKTFFDKEIYRLLMNYHNSPKQKLKRLLEDKEV